MNGQNPGAHQSCFWGRKAWLLEWESQWSLFINLTIITETPTCLTASHPPPDSSRPHSDSLHTPVCAGTLEAAGVCSKAV